MITEKEKILKEMAFIQFENNGYTLTIHLNDRLLENVKALFNAIQAYAFRWKNFKQNDRFWYSSEGCLTCRLSDHSAKILVFC